VSKAILLNKDVKIVLPLVPTKPAAHWHRSPPVATTQAAPQTTPPPRSTATATDSSNCTPPFYFDEQGIKKLKPECL
jgi:hypothetical protein